MSQFKKFACPCCGYKTLEEEPPGTNDICPICFWEDDAVQFADPNYEGGANKPGHRALKTILQLHPFDSLPGLTHRYFFDVVKVRAARGVIQQLLGFRGWPNAVITTREEIGGTYVSIEFEISYEQ